MKPGRTSYIFRSPPRKRGSSACGKELARFRGDERQKSDSTPWKLALAISSLLWLACAPATAADAPPGASSCSGCHPASRAVETPAGRLIGHSAAEIVTAMQAFRSGQRPSTIMGRIAKGFTDAETKAIADWYGAQKD